MADTVELDIGLHHRDAETWSVEVRCDRPNADADVLLVRSVARPDLAVLRQYILDSSKYGRLLTKTLFDDVPDVVGVFRKARAIAEEGQVPLRVRLFVGPSAPELHALRWETLRDPEYDAPLFTGDNVLFSRYLSSLDWRPVAVRVKSDLRAVVLVANPSDLASYEPDGRVLAPIDVAGELEQARSALGSVEIVALGADRRATLANLHDALREECDILYLLCHGYLAGEDPWLLLEHEDGTVHRVAGIALVDQLREMKRPPRLVVLVSCQSAGDGNGLGDPCGNGLAALGPRLAEAGVPAVLAMQGNISVETARRFIPKFFEQLHRDGQIDRAMAVARSAVRDRHDWWVPALFMRFKSGRIWYRPRFADDPFARWPAIINEIDQGRCTPILGPGLTEALLGTRQELALRWASTYNFPLAPHAQRDLPQVAQYLAIQQNERFPKDALARYALRELLDRYGDVLPEQVRRDSLDDVMTAVGEWLRATHEAEPHKVLAELPFPIYVTTHPANLLSDALRAAGRQPEVELCRWRSDFQWPSTFESEPRYRPNQQRPLVFHLFGRLQPRDSLVLTEDDYFDYLIGVTSNRDLIPPVVRRALADTSLLFLGFRMDEWGFRVLFRSIMNQAGSQLLNKYAHVAVQIDPEEGTTLEPERARRYLESYFQGARITIYWGSVEDFVRELKARWEKPEP